MIICPCIAKQNKCPLVCVRLVSYCHSQKNSLVWHSTPCFYIILLWTNRPQVMTNHVKRTHSFLFPKYNQLVTWGTLLPVKKMIEQKFHPPVGEYESTHIALSSWRMVSIFCIVSLKSWRSEDTAQRESWWCARFGIFAPFLPIFSGLDLLLWRWQQHVLLRSWVLWM